MTLRSKIIPSLTPWFRSALVQRPTTRNLSSSLRPSAKPTAASFHPRNHSTTSDGGPSSKKEKDSNVILDGALWFIVALIWLHHRYRTSQAKEKTKKLDQYLTQSIHLLHTKAVDSRNNIHFANYHQTAEHYIRLIKPFEANWETLLYLLKRHYEADDVSQRDKEEVHEVVKGAVKEIQKELDKVPSLANSYNLLSAIHRSRGQVADTLRWVLMGENKNEVLG